MNAADDAKVKDRQDELKLERERELNDLRLILQTPEGKRFFGRMFKLGHMEQEPFTGNSSTFYNLGMRQFALKYWNDVKEADRAAFVEIITGGK